MNQTALVIVAATVLLWLGMWLLLPRGNARGSKLGALLTLAAVCLLASRVPRLAEWGPLGGWADDVTDFVFLALSLVTIVAAVATVSVRSPVYCAIWFALSLLATAGLLLYQGSQFLGVATIVVYAGAILVTFLFVLMLAQPEGHAYYDRLSWEGMLSALTGAVLVGILTMTFTGALGDSASKTTSAGASPQMREDNVLAREHVARLGGELFSRHLVAVEIAGTLLLVALVGAVAIVAEKENRRRSRPGMLESSGARVEGLRPGAEGTVERSLHA